MVPELGKPLIKVEGFEWKLVVEAFQPLEKQTVAQLLKVSIEAKNY